MRSMKTLLRLLGAVSLTTVAASSIVACGKDKVTNMDTQIQKDFGFLDAQGKSLIKVKISVKINTKLAQWKSDQLVARISANNLLENGGTSAKAKSADAANFLVDVLKLKVESGTGADRTFKHNSANAIDLIVKEYLPIINKKTDNSDYVVTGGTVTIKFKKDGKQLGDDYSLDILGDQSTGIILSILPQASNITLDDFETIPGFKVGQPKDAFPVDKDLTQYFKTTENEGKKIKSIVDLIKKDDLKIKVSQAASGTGNFASGDTVKIKISIGEVTFATEYILTIA